MAAKHSSKPRLAAVAKPASRADDAVKSIGGECVDAVYQVLGLITAIDALVDKASDLAGDAGAQDTCFLAMGHCLKFADERLRALTGKLEYCGLALKEAANG